MEKLTKALMTDETGQEIVEKLNALSGQMHELAMATRGNAILFESESDISVLGDGGYLAVYVGSTNPLEISEWTGDNSLVTGHLYHLVKSGTDVASRDLGEYGGTAVTDKTLELPNVPADSETSGLALAALDTRVTAVEGDILELQDGGYVADQQKIAEKINDWLEEHPEATTTVQDGSLTYKKFVTGTLGFVMPEMFGAVGDGTVVDSDAINSAILKCTETGLPLYLTGNYLVDYEKPVVLSGINNLTIVGKNAMIKLKDQSTVLGTGRYYLFEIIDCSNIEIFGVAFNGNRDNLGLSDADRDKPNHLADGVYIKESTNIYIHDCKFTKFVAFGIYCMSSVSVSYTDPNISGLKICNNYFEYCMNAVKILEGISNTIEFSGNVCMKIDTHGISFYPTATNVIVKNNIIESGVTGTVIISGVTQESGCGIRLYETNNVVVDGNIILTANVTGILMGIKPTNPAIPSNITISNNQILEVVDGQGIYFQGGTKAVVSGNIINKTYKSGIYLVVNHCIVTDNELNDITAYNTSCIVINGSDNIVENNILNNSEKYGIHLFDDNGKNNIVNDNIIIGGTALNNGINIKGECKIGHNYISNYVNAPYFENSNDIQYTTPKIIYNCSFDVNVVTSGDYSTDGLIDGLPSITIPQNCTLLRLIGYVKDPTTAGTLQLRIYKNGTILSTTAGIDLSSQQTVETYLRKGRQLPYADFLFEKGDVLTVKAFRDSNYTPGNTNAVLQLVFDCDR